jgi:hypothetical protein
MDQNDEGGFLDKAKNAINNLFGGEDQAAADDVPANIATDVPSVTATPAVDYKTGTDQDTATGDYPTATGAGTGVVDPSLADPADFAASSTNEYSPQYKSGTDQDSPTGDYPTETDTLDWNASTETEVVSPAPTFDANTTSTVGATPGVARTTAGETPYDAGAGTGSSLSGSDTPLQPTEEYGMETETIRRTPEEDTADQP